MLAMKRWGINSGGKDTGLRSMSSFLSPPVLKRLRHWLRKRGNTTHPLPPPPESGTLLPIEQIAFEGKKQPRIDSACHAGMANSSINMT
jgi:hypothetical protein